MFSNISYICKMNKNILYGFLIYIVMVGAAFFLAPLLTYLFLILGSLIAGFGYVLDVLLCLVLWWAGFEGGIGQTLMESIEVMSPTTAWLIFTGIVTIVFLIFLYRYWGKTLQQSEKAYYPYPSVNIDVERDFSPLIKDIIDDYRIGEITKELANRYIKIRFKQWLRKEYNVKNEKDIEAVWENKKWIIEIKESPKPAYPSGISPEGEMVLSLRADYEKGKKTMEEANKKIRMVIDIWAENNHHSKERADEMYEKFKVKPKKKK